MFGDPCSGTHKYLEAHYDCIPGWLIKNKFGRRYFTFILLLQMEKILIKSILGLHDKFITCHAVFSNIIKIKLKIFLYKIFFNKTIYLNVPYFNI